MGRDELLARLSGELVDRYELLARLSSGPPPLAEDLLEYGEKQTAANYRARYNLACYYAERALRQTDPDEASKDLDNALEKLGIAFDESPGTGLDTWAVRDPSFKALWESPKFYELVWKTSDPTPLSKVEAIGASGAQKLAAAGVNAEDLATAAGHGCEGRAKMRELKKKLSEERKHLRAWAKVVELMQCIHAKPEEVNLLADVGVRSIKDLVAWPERLLVKALTEANAVLERTDSVDKTRVRGWLLLAGARERLPRHWW